MATDEARNDVENFCRNGYIVLEEALSPPRVQELRSLFLAALDRKVARFGLAPAVPDESDALPHARVLNDFRPRGGNHDINRWNMHLPSVEPFLRADLLANARVLRVVHELIGKDAVAYLLASDTPFPGSTFQSIHQDFSRFSIALNVPLVDVTDENGPIEVWPGTHRSDRREGARFTSEPYAISPESMKLLAQEAPSKRLLGAAGTMIVRDHRLMHRGTANRSREPRPMLSVYYASPHAVPPRWMADVGAWVAKRVRVGARGAGDAIQRPVAFGLGNVLGRVVEECSLSDRDYRRPIPREIWNALPPEVRALLRYSRVEGQPAGVLGQGSVRGATHFLREVRGNVIESLVSSLHGRARRPDQAVDGPRSRRDSKPDALTSSAPCDDVVGHV